MTIDDIVEYFKKHKGAVHKGKGCLAERLHCSEESIIAARKRYYAETKKGNNSKILLFDVETAPMRAYVWGRWKQNISLEATISEWFMLCWSAKWLYSSEIISDKLTSEEALAEDDQRIVKHLWELIDEADIIIAYNGKRADIPWMNTRFIVNNMLPPSPYFIIDPCEVAKKSFGFSSNKLDALAGYFNIEHKMDTDFSLWDRALKGSQEALDYMSTYCGKDVKILEEVYLKLRPYIKNHPNVGNFLSSKEPLCSSCGSRNLEELKNKFYYTSVGKYKLYRCKECGALSRGRVNYNIHNMTPNVSLGH